MKNKLKTLSQWDSIRDSQDMLLLMEEIKNIMFKFEDQKYPVLSIHNAKQEFYAYRQHDLPIAVYLQKFRNLADIASSLDGNLHDDAIAKIVVERDFSVDDPRDSSLTKAEK